MLIIRSKENEEILFENIYALYADLSDLDDLDLVTCREIMKKRTEECLAILTGNK